MLLLRYVLLASGATLFAIAACVLLFDAHRAWRLSRSLAPHDMATPPIRLRCRLAARLVVFGFLTLLPALSESMPVLLSRP
jgi:hypothetical protein